MKTSGYRVSVRLDPSSNAAWIAFLKFSSLTHLTEVVGLDGSLCPVELDGLSREDRLHVMHADHLFGVFDSAEYAVLRCPLRPRNQLLALVREPSRDDVRGLELPGFEFKGFELIEEQTETSALTNCGGFPRAFAPEDLSESGLITDLDRAYAVRSKLRQEHPDEDHADCAVWAIWRQNAVRT